MNSNITNHNDGKNDGKYGKKNESLFQMNKINAGEYIIQFNLENNNIQLNNIIDFHLLKLLYDLNMDIYEKIDLKILDKNEAILLAINKHLFQDLGITQKYSLLKIKKNIFTKENKIVFDLQSIKETHQVPVPEKAEQMPIEKFTIVCNVINEHKIEVIIDFKIDIGLFQMPDFVENALRKIFIKMFKRIKQFIDNIE
jgi:hypothetical protein